MCLAWPAPSVAASVGDVATMLAACHGASQIAPADGRRRLPLRTVPARGVRVLTFCVVNEIENRKAFIVC